MIFSAQDLGFGEDAELRDRLQMQFIALLVRQGASRFILKGGMAMRALYGSARLTKDVDFDCEDNVSPQSMHTQMTRALTQGARIAGITRADVQQTKKGDRANRWRIAGVTGTGITVAWEAEVSRRGAPPSQFIETRPFGSPVTYRIPAFSVRVYSPAAMAGGKVNALLSDNRNVPRDIYDLHDLIGNQADPTELWAQSVPRENLRRKLPMVMTKIDGIDFALANAELLPYLAPDARASIDEKHWDEIRIEVAEHVEHWIEQAIEKAKPAEETQHGADDEVDLAGR